MTSRLKGGLSGPHGGPASATGAKPAAASAATQTVKKVARTTCLPPPRSSLLAGVAVYSLTDAVLLRPSRCQLGSIPARIGDGGIAAELLRGEQIRGRSEGVVRQAVALWVLRSVRLQR